MAMATKETPQAYAIFALTDRSWSMSDTCAGDGNQQRTVDGLNAFMDQMRRDSRGKDAHFDLKQFDSQGFDPLRRGILSQIEPIKVSEFVPRAATPLFDAVADLISRAEAYGARKTALVISTDGLENCSHHTLAEVSRMIEAKRKLGWIVIYLGANINAWKEAEKLGIPGSMALNFSQRKTTVPAQRYRSTGMLFERFSGHIAQHPIAYAFAAAAALVALYLGLSESDVSAAESVGFNDEDRSAAMGVTGAEGDGWRNAVIAEVLDFKEPVSGDSLLDLPPDAADAQRLLPEDFDPALGSMVNGRQLGDDGGDILSADDVPGGGNPASESDSDKTDPISSDSAVVDGDSGREELDVVEWPPRRVDVARDGWTPDPDPVPDAGGSVDFDLGD